MIKIIISPSEHDIAVDDSNVLTACHDDEEVFRSQLSLKICSEMFYSEVLLLLLVSFLISLRTAVDAQARTKPSSMRLVNASTLGIFEPRY